MGSGGGVGGFLSMPFSVAANEERNIAQQRELDAAAKQREAQAQEELRKTRLNLSAFKKKAEIALGENISSYAKAGVDISESPLLQIAQTKSELGKQAADIERTGLENARLLQAGAKAIREQKKDIDRASGFQTAGTILGGFGGLMGGS